MIQTQIKFMHQPIRKQVNDLLEIKMKIPLFEDESPLSRVDGEETEIPLTDARAVEMACENVNWQADNEYFDATFEIWVNGELFFENVTTDPYCTWRGLMDAIERPGKHNVYFLDSSIDLKIIHDQQYTFQFIDIEYVWGDDDYLISSSKKTMTSEPLPKEVVETAIRQGFREFAEFMLDNDIPISTAYKEELRARLVEV